MSTTDFSCQCTGRRPCLTGKIIEMLRDLPEVEGEAPYLEIKVLLEESEPMLRQEIEDALVGKNIVWHELFLPIVRKEG